MNPSPVLYEESQGFAPWAYVLMGAILLLLLGVLSLRLQTVLRRDVLTVRYGFLGGARVALTEIARAEAVVYRPVADYGGWGLRGFGSRRAINARGDRGVLITRRDGSTLLVGSQDPRRLIQALAAAGVATEDKLPPDVRDF